MDEQKITVPKVIKDPKFKPEFPEDFTNIKGLDPLAPTHIGFDWEIIRLQLREAKDDMTGADWALLADTLSQILAWIVCCKSLDSSRGDTSKLELIGRRAVALAWTVNPQLLGGRSGVELCKALGFRKERLAENCAAASKRFGIRNRSQTVGTKGAAK